MDKGIINGYFVSRNGHKLKREIFVYLGWVVVQNTKFIAFTYDSDKLQNGVCLDDLKIVDSINSQKPIRDIQDLIDFVTER